MHQKTEPHIATRSGAWSRTVTRTMHDRAVGPQGRVEGHEKRPPVQWRYVAEIGCGTARPLGMASDGGSLVRTAVGPVSFSDPHMHGFAKCDSERDKHERVARLPVLHTADRSMSFFVYVTFTHPQHDNPAR